MTALARPALSERRTPVRITDVREMVVPIKSAISNAYIDFSQMTVSVVVAVVTDAIRAGKPVVGFGFNSNGRYAPSGLLRERFIPRLRDADPLSLMDEEHGNLDPHKAWAADDEKREAGRPRRALGRGRRARHGHLGRGREDRGKAALPRARRALSRRRGC
jgi:hypothetical protein